MTMSPTVLIGVDGATFTILDDLIALGELPHLAAFVARGVRAELSSTPHPLTPPAWTTLMTGRTPGQHGIFDFQRVQVRSGGAFFTLNNFRNIQCETMWTIVSRQGGRVISLNFPLMAPPPAISGAMIPGLISWRHLRRNLTPPELYDELKSLPEFDAKQISWDFEHENKALQALPEEELRPWIRFHIARERHWQSILQHLMQTRPADLTAVMFDGVDKLQHICWQYLDRSQAPQTDDPAYRELREMCLQYFRQLDGFVGEIVDKAGPAARVFIASDHGFGPCTRVFRANKWLERNGYLHWLTASADREVAPGTARREGAGPFVALDWERTTAYVPSSATNGIHIRVKQNPDDPGVSPEEYPAFRQRLIDQLLAVRDPHTDRPLIKSILTKDEAFAGEHNELAPDLTLALFDHGFVSILDADPIVALRLPVTGTHYPQGILLAAGPGIPQGRTLPRQTILDVAPTLLYSLGLPIPQDFEGRVMTDVFESAQLTRQPVQSGPPTRRPGAPDEPEESDPEQDAMIIERLRALGYVE